MVADDLGRAKRGNPQARAYLRNLAASTDEQYPDAQGRITLSAEHRRYANLTKECVVTGSIDFLEIWDAQAWQDYQELTKRTSPRPAMKHSATSFDLAPQARAARPLPEPALTYFPDVRSVFSDRDLAAGAAPIPHGAAMVDEPHVPVLLDRCVELLAPALTRRDADGTGATLVDATLGAGGHTRAFPRPVPRPAGDRPGPRPRRPADRRRPARTVRRSLHAGAHPLRRVST